MKNSIGLILLYHRVAELPTDPWSLAVTPAHFNEHLDVLRNHASPLRLEEFTKRWDEGTLPERAVLVTFDDGYADNLYVAKPLMEHHGVPGAVFVTTEAVFLQREFWWDELDQLLLQPGRLPEVLHLRQNNRIYQWELGKDADYREDVFIKQRRWRALEDPPGTRQLLYRSLWELLYGLPADRRRKVLDELHDWAGSKTICRPTHRPLSWKELRVLAEGGFMGVGAHTKTHSVLSTLSAALQRFEVAQSKVDLEQILNQEVICFAYPHGKYSNETKLTVRESGFMYACSTLASAVGPGVDRYELPRMSVDDWDGNEFAGRLTTWLKT